MKKQLDTLLGGSHSGGTGFVIPVNDTMAAIMQKTPSRMRTAGDVWIASRLLKFSTTSYSQVAIPQAGSGNNTNYGYASRNGHIIANFCSNNSLVIFKLNTTFTGYTTLVSASNFNVLKPVMLDDKYYYNLNIYNENGESVKTFDSSPFRSEANYKLYFTGFVLEFETSTGNIYIYVYDDVNLTFTLQETILEKGIISTSFGGCTMQSFPHSMQDYIICWNSGKTQYYIYNSVAGEQLLTSMTREGVNYYNLIGCNLTEGSELLKGTTAYGISGLITGSMPNNGAINITPSTSAQIIPAGYTSGGVVSAVALQSKTATPTTSQQIITPDSGNTGLNSVTVEAVDNTIDENIVAGNIKKDITILGVTGTLEEGSGGGDETVLKFENLDNVEVVTENGKNVLVLTNSLPYTKLEYIESTGTQYINTNTYVKANTRIELDIALDSASGDQKLFGSYGTGGICLGTLNNQWRYGNHNWQGTVGTTTTDKILITVQGSTFTFGETQITGSAISANTQSAMILSAVAYNGTVTDKSSIKIYGLKIYENTDLVRDFIPVKRKSDNIVCLYDKTTGSYFTNQGTGTFVAGPEVQGGNS